MGIETAILGSAAIGAASSIFGGNKAADAQERAAKRQRQQFEETKELLSPFVQSGELALEDLQASLGLSGEEAQREFFEDFQTDPGFAEASQFGLDQVQDRFELSGRTGGNLLSALSDRARRDLLGQFQIRQQQLASLAGQGQSAASSLAGAGQNSAAREGQFISNAGALRGNALIGAGNAVTGAADQFALLQGQQAGQQQIGNASALAGQTQVPPLPGFSNRLTF